MTEQEKRIYNCFIATTRSKQNKPFKIRKDFKRFEEKENYNLTKRLAIFFKKYPQIKVEEFFAAPYHIHPDTANLSLSYYLTRAAIKAYSLYQKKLQDISPEAQIENIRNSMQFIGGFCLKQHIYLHQYLEHKTGCIYSWMMHYREHKINIYSLFEIGDLISHVAKVSIDEKELLTDNLQQTVAIFKTRYHNSSITKKFVKECTEKIQNYLITSLKSSS